MFSLYSNPIELAHQYWARLLTPRDRAIDATCGNGRDTLALAELAGAVEAWDIQKKAVQQTESLVSHFDHVAVKQGCHSQFADQINGKIKLGVYNLGYLPGGDKGITTRAETTLASIKSLSRCLEPGGALSITCYPGHAEGAREEATLLNWAAKLPQQEWCVVHHRFVNRRSSPSFLWIQKTRGQDSSSRTE